MRLAHNILENHYQFNNNIKAYGQLSGMKKLLAKGENGRFWAKDFDITGAEMVGLAYLPVVKETGVTKEVEIELSYWDFYARKKKTYKKMVIVKEWELLDYDRLKKAYELIMELINL